MDIVDVRTVAEFSGGNARIAIALARTIGENETIAGLTDEDLFQRLFRQRHEHDESLYLAAQVCSLVYSFQGEDISDGDQAELGRLGALVGKDAQEIFRSVAELHRRNLVQHRSVWRTVLPHAIANRLAATALQNIPAALFFDTNRRSHNARKIKPPVLPACCAFEKLRTDTSLLFVVSVPGCRDERNGA